ncbi:MAG: hypothetical protein P4N41_18060 [Negativicutes bacterium]|nr:hypothetical protein [Negativicutes bacterium]
MVAVFNKTTNPGIHPTVKLEGFSKDEQAIITYFAEQWYVTRHFILSMARSKYKAILIKPVEHYKERFNIEREIIVVFSEYDCFEPRSLDAIAEVSKLCQDLRLEEICSILISKDSHIVKKIRDLLKSNQESQIIIPFSYEELLNNVRNKHYIVNCFEANFYSRDLFAFESPLRKDLYFFGRTDEVHSLLNRHLSYENSGVFGLRKTGKTSILYGLQRALLRKNGISVWVDCEVLHFKRWNQALYYIAGELHKNNGIKAKYTEEDYQESKAFESFENSLLTIYKAKGKRSILIIFDEIEHITFGISPSEHWRNGSDFVKFWQVIRATFQKHNNLFTYVIAGTNPMCVEKPSINGIDNPIYSQIPFDSYIGQFNFEQTKEMVSKLGGYMGLLFSDNICSLLTQDYGGHPFLIRHVCSTINRMVTEAKLIKPVKISRSFYEKAKPIFDQERGQKYSEMILEVLEKYYSDEFCMLERLAVGDMEFFNEFARTSNSYTAHLIGYGILEKEIDDYDFKIDTLKRYLIDKNKYIRLNLTNAEKQAEINSRRNKVEPALRKIVRTQLKAILGEEEAKKAVLNKYSDNIKRKASSLAYNDLFDPNKHEIYFDDLRLLMNRYWENCFRNLFETDVEKFNSRMVLINMYRKGDCHAADISDADMESFRGNMAWLEEKIKEIS